jgi:hypothetical protein
LFWWFNLLVNSVEYIQQSFKALDINNQPRITRQKATQARLRRGKQDGEKLSGIMFKRQI